jgi:ABC-type transporter Mla subunit MlaD
MSSKPNDFKLGLFVLFGVAILFAGFFIFGASHWFQHKTLQETYIAGNVDGLKVGSQVTLRGVPVGQVTAIDFTWNIYHQTEPRYVYVEFEVNKKVSLASPGAQYRQLVEEEVRKGLRARIKSQGLASGASIVSLEYLNPTEYPPLNVSWEPRHIYIPSAPGQFTEILSNLDQTVAGIKKIDFAKIGTLLETDLNAGKTFLMHADEMNLRGISTNLNGLIVDVRSVAGQLREFIGTTNLGGTNLQQIARHADELVGRLQTASSKLNQALANLDLASFNETLENLRRVSQELDETIIHIKQYPAGALFGRPPPPARSVERTGQ